ncbi:zinc finger CCCH domain-containing protein 13-like [Ooceraea biroi]|uniref:zinc finger CCCH domain-containing protein 13-like n=1 Tax=Ooceraea biroi TaxID=2015173 RepID=UPI000F077593|nr:zinc finger CCCH domain-containing protein 13-like [Ooceraea biroi]
MVWSFRFQRERDRERDIPRSREPRDGYGTYYGDSPAHDYQFRDRERDLPPRERPLPRYPIRNQPSQHNIPPLMPHLVPGGHAPPPLMSLGPTDRKDYYDSYNRYSGPPPPQRFGSPLRDPPPHKRFDDVAPPGTEGYYDLSPPGVEHSERSLRDDRERQRSLRDQEDRDHSSKDRDNEERDRLRDDRGRDREDRMRERDDRDRRAANRDREDRDRQPPLRDHEDRLREKDERDRREKEKERDDRHVRDRREDDRHIEKKDYDKDRYRDDRDRHRQDEKNRPREKERREREYETEKDRDRHERYERRSMERKKSRKSLSPYSQKSRDPKEQLSPERNMKKKEKDHEEKAEEKKKEKKIKEKKKKKDSDEKEKKKKKKKDKKSNQKEASKDDSIKAIETQVMLIESKAMNDVPSSPLKAEKTSNNEEDNIESRIECITSDASIMPIKEEFEAKSLAMNPEPPEFNESRLDRAEFGTNPPNPNFKPIPELKSDMKPIDSLYGGLDDAEINTVITEKYTLLSEHLETPEAKEIITAAALTTEKSPKKDEFLAPIPELSKWERDDTIEKPDDEEEGASGSPTEKLQREDEPKSMKMVTSEVLKRAENAIFQKAINAIRPIEIKKISESRKILYQNPELKVLETAEPPVAPNREPRKSVNVTINVGRNERNVEITEPVKKAKLDRTKFKPVPETTAYSPTRLSAKERLGEKVEDSKERKISPIKGFLERRDSKSENQSRSRSPRREKRMPSPVPDRRADASSSALNTSSERKVFLEERKRDNKDRGDRSKERSDFRGERHSGGDLRSDRESRVDCRPDFRSGRSDVKGDRERERRGRTPPSASCAQFKKTEMSKLNLLKPKDEEEERRREKKPREEKKRKKEHRSRSKSKEHKKRKEKKHKKDKEKNQEKKQKHKEAAASKDKSDSNPETKINYENIDPSSLTDSLKKQRKNPKLVSDRKRSILDEANFEPDYSASDSESDGEDKTLPPTKKFKLNEAELDKEMEMKPLKKRSRSSSSEDSSSSSDTTSSDSDSSDESHKKKRKKHKKHKKKKSTKKDSSSDSDTYSDSSDSSSDEEKHKKKSKKSKSRSKQSKKKKKSKHK